MQMSHTDRKIFVVLVSNNAFYINYLFHYIYIARIDKGILETS